MADRRPHARPAVPLALGLLLACPALAQAPDLALLEYLGSFDEDDESWYVDVQMREADPGAPPAAPIDAPDRHPDGERTPPGANAAPPRDEVAAAEDDDE